MSLLCPARICQRIFKLSNSCAISRRCKYDMPSSSPLVTKGIHWDGSLERIQNLVLHEDNHMIVLYKPSTVLMQGDLSGDDNLLDATKRYLWYQKPAAYTGLIHRVDRPCSGVVVFAKTSKCAARLSDQFRMRSVLKYYVCMVNGKVLKESGACNHLLLKVKGEKTACLELSESKKRPDAVAGALKYQVIHRVKDSNNAANEEREQTLLAITLETGRKHQIRAQLAHIGHPIVGDIKYGAPQRFRSKEIALHSCILSFAHPITDNQVSFNANAPTSWLYRFGDAPLQAINRFVNRHKQTHNQQLKDQESLESLEADMKHSARAAGKSHPLLGSSALDSSSLPSSAAVSKTINRRQYTPQESISNMLKEQQTSVDDTSRRFGNRNSSKNRSVKNSGRLVKPIPASKSNRNTSRTTSRTSRTSSH